MPPRHLRLVLALLLPLLVLRALLPAGTMPVAQDGQLQIVLCSAGLNPDAGDGDTDLPSGAGDCVFAHAAPFAPLAAPVIAGVAPPPAAGFRSVESSSLPPATGPPRRAAARAPPAPLV